MKKKKVLGRTAMAAAVLAAAWLLPPALHQALRYCPVRPDGTRQAEAFPSFARKYGVSCSRCHVGFPVINAYGRQFKLNGYVMGKGDNEGVLESDDKQLWTEKVFPWALIVRSRPFDNGRQKVSNQGSQMGGTKSPNPNGLKAEPINDVDFFVAGGDVARKISYMGELDANAPGGFTPSMGDIRLGYHPFDWANIVAARRGFFVDDPYQTISSAESPTVADRATDLLLSDQGSISGNKITGTQQTLYLYGTAHVPGSEAFLYYAGGATKDSDSGQQATSPTNGAARLAFDTGKGLMIGTFGSYGHAGPADSSGVTGAPAGVFALQQFVRAGVDALWEIGDLAARGAAVYGHDEDPSGAGLKSTDRAAYAELSYAYKRGGKDYPFLMPLVRENWYSTFNGKEQFNFVTTQLAHYFAPNLRAFAEYSFDTKHGYQGGTLADVTGANGSPAVLALRGNRATVQIEVGF